MVDHPAPAGAAGRWLAHEAPEVASPQGLKPLAVPQSPRGPPMFCALSCGASFGGLDTDRRGRFGEASSGPRVSAQGRLLPERDSYNVWPLTALARAFIRLGLAYACWSVVVDCRRSESSVNQAVGLTTRTRKRFEARPAFCLGRFSRQPANGWESRPSLGSSNPSGR